MMGTSSCVARVTKSDGDRMGAHGFSPARRMPRQDATTSCPCTALSSAAPSSTSPTRTSTPGGATKPLEARTSAVTSCPRSAARRVSHLPTPPDAPRMRTRTLESIIPDLKERFVTILPRASVGLFLMLALATAAQAQRAGQPDWTSIETETLQHFQALLRF